jgi:hypothetical protein
MIEEILALKEPPPLELLPIAHYGSYSACTDDLLPSDIQYFGGKAANFGILRKAIPENSPVSVALSFALWSEFLGQKLFGGRTLREEIDARLEPYIQPPINPVALSAVLGGIRGLFTSTSVTSFTDTQKQAIIDILQDNQYEFDPIKKIRFRSSTNMEDSEQFTGAGLYDSYSGCLADELDMDDTGPCRCDPTESNERGVFRAIRKVFASFYNDNAFLERLRYDVNEHEVGMAILVHHSFPDEIELANGVAAVKRKHSTSWDITLVTQKGATSVTNPADGSIPEEVNVLVYSFGVFPTLVRQSNLVPLGGKVMDWQDDYIKLSELLVKIGEQFGEVTGKDRFLLEMEYKKVAPDGKLVVKQVRQIPQPDKTPSITPFLVNEPVEYCTFQGEFSDVFANHRLKSQWLFETDSLWLSKENLAESFYAAINLEYVADARIRSLMGRPSLWPMSSHNYVGDTTSDDWLMHHLSNQRSCRLLITGIPDLVSPAQSPILTLSDMGWMTLEVEYEEPVPFWDWDGGGKTKIDKISLSPCPKPQTGDLLQERQFKGPDGISVKTSFYWPPPPKGPGAGYTAPLIRWVETIIEGYTSEPMVLHGYYSQTYRPEHHNFDEHFVFEPQLEPEISIDILAELRIRDVRMIHIFGGMSGTRIKTYGYEDKSFVVGDISGDGNVDVSDFALFGEYWLRVACDTCGGADLTGDGEVGFNDLVEFVDNWLAGVE